jgi:prohibitin 2
MKLLLKIFDNFVNFLSKIWFVHKVKIIVITLVFLLFVAYFWNNIFVSIDSGNVGILWNRFGGTDIEHFYDEGLHVIFPWDNMYIYNTREQTVNDSMDILTTGGLTVEVSFTYRYAPLKDSVGSIHKTMGPNYNMSYIWPKIQGAALSIIGNNTPEKLYRMSTLIIQANIKYYVMKELAYHNITLIDFIIRKITLPNRISEAIEQKLSQEQRAYEFDYRIIIEQKEKQRKIVEAEGLKQFEAISGVSVLKWKSLEVTSEFAKSKNTKTVIIGNSANGLPIILNSEGK